MGLLTLCSTYCVRFDSLLMGISLLICVIMKTQKERGIKNHMNCMVGIEIDNSSSNSLNAKYRPLVVVISPHGFLLD